MIVMRWRMSFVLMFAVAAPSLAAAPRKPAPMPKKEAVPQLMQSCEAHKFETVVNATIDGETRQSKVKLCGVEGQSDADWVKTLRDAIAKLKANKEMAPAARDQIVTAINAEIARLSISGSAVASGGKGSDLASLPPSPPLTKGYSTLPPLPPPREMPAAPIQNDFAVLPPLPPAPSPAVAASKPRPAPIPAPRLSFGCEAPGDLTSGASCVDFERETLLTVRAGDDVPPGTALQFVRNGRVQADVPLEGLRRGGALRMALPAKVCSGFTNGKLELRIVHSAAGAIEDVLASDGPYSLRC